jgi:hypothetical protein
MLQLFGSSGQAFLCGTPAISLLQLLALVLIVVKVSVRLT